MNKNFKELSQGPQLIFLFSIFIFIACGSSAPNKKAIPPLQEHYEQSKETKQRIIKPSTITAPWQTWQGEGLGDIDLELAEDFVTKGDLKQALVVYQKIERESQNSNIRYEAFIRRLGTELKFGTSKEVLNQLSKYATNQLIAVDKLNPRLALIAAFAYLHLNQVDQALAWFNVSYNNAYHPSKEADLAKAEAAQVISSIADDNFADSVTKWRGDRFIASLFNEERYRREQGGVVQKRFLKNWYRPETYSADEQEAEQAATDLLELEKGYAPPVIPASDQFIIGILLPFSGQFAEHAERVRRGIELAVETAGGANPPKIVQADTEAKAEKAASEYERLIREEGAKIVVGPMEVKGTETVASRSETIRVPFISFTKKARITEASNLMFRLGVTVDNQVEELVNYAIDILHYNRFSMIYPDNDSGHEFAVAFQEYLSKRSAELVKSANYQNSGGQTAEQAVEQLGEDLGDALFIADSLENSRSGIMALRTKGSKVVFLGPAFWNDSTAIRSLGYLLDRSIYVTPYYAWSNQPIVQDFKQRFKTKYASEPDILSAQAYDATTLALRASLGRTTDPKEISSLIHSYNEMRGVTGELMIDQSGEIKRRMTVVQIQDGSTSEVMVAGELIGVVPNGQEEQSEQNSSEQPNEEQNSEMGNTSSPAE